MKEYIIIFNSGNDNVPDAHRYNICGFEIMAGGIAPKAQPLDVLLGKLIKGLYIEYYDYYMLSEPSNDRGHPISPTCQLCPTCVVKSCNKLP